MPSGDEMPAVVQRMLDATNAGDSAAFLDCFADDGVVEDWGREFVGRERIASWNDGENIGVQSQIAVQEVKTDPRPDGVEVTLTITVTGNGYNGGGSFVVTVRSDRIARLTIRG
jgi:uncharacterized protein (TIGR02246 family)